MGLFDFIQGELIEVIGWLDSTQDTIVWRFPTKTTQSRWEPN